MPGIDSVKRPRKTDCRLMAAIHRAGWALGMAAWLLSASAVAQDSFKPREFPQFRGTWILDEKATEGLRQVERTGALFDALGSPVARKLLIATTPTEISVTKDSGLAEVYLFDGSENQVRDPRTNAPLIPRYRFTLVAGLLALTVTTPRERTIEIITDAYSMPDWNVLQVERQLNIVTQEGTLLTLSRDRPFPFTIVYRREQ